MNLHSSAGFGGGPSGADMGLRRLRKQAVIATMVAIATVAGTGTWLTHVAAVSREREIIRHVGVGLAFADSIERALVERRANSITSAEAVAVLYLERLRLGLGSPFRLIEQAVRDPAIQSLDATRFAEAMLARALIGDTYLSRSAALELLNVDAGMRSRGLGRQHQAIIDSVVSAAHDPRVGELTLRLAYRLASASGALSRRAPEIATAAAAQARDRILAMRDARALLGTADRNGVGRVSLLRSWRETRRFMVEQPVLVPLAARAERVAVAQLPSLVSRIEAVAQSAGEPVAIDSRAVEERRRSDALAVRMAAVAAARDLPPIAPVTVAVRGYSGLLLATSSTDRFNRLRFVDRATGEESLAAEYVLLTVRSTRPVPEADAALLTAAVALRPFAQERAWLPGDASMTARDLQSRFGIAVTYDAVTRASWRPFLHRALELAIVDMKRVLPGFDTRGLKVHFGASPLGDRALAMHDPIRRTIYFPPTSSSGVMAHEFAHDLDWQAARREYGGTGWYRTDHALRQSADRLAGALRQMAGAMRVDSQRARVSGAGRPTEILARNVDWFVSASLAREGRVNGYLSAAQDPVLTGYASAITPEAARDGGSATLRALDGLTSVPAAARTWFSGLYGVERRLTVHEAVRRVLEAPIGRVNVSGQHRFAPWAPDGRGLGAGVSIGASWICLVGDFAGRSGDESAVRSAMQYAAEARARGVVREWAGFARRRPDVSPPGLRALTGPPWDPTIAESTLREIRDAILWSALTPRWDMGEGRWERGRTSSSC